MNYTEFLDRVISDGIEAAKEDYKEGDNRRDGSIQGFINCKGKLPHELADLLAESRKKANEIFIRSNDGDQKDVDEYWYYQSIALEIEWVCNSVSAGLLYSGLEPMIAPTCRGMMNAARILGTEKISIT